MSEILTFIIQCFAVTLSIATAIAFTYFCIRALSLLFQPKDKISKIIRVSDFVAPGTTVDVTLNNGRNYTGVKFIGFTNFTSKNDVPYPLWNWAVLENDEGKIFIKPDSIKIIQQHAVEKAQ